MSVTNKKIKVYVVGTATSYASWLNCDLVQTMEEADLVLFTGGSDVDPSLYNEKKGKFTSIYAERDMYEVKEAEKAISLGKNIWGTCRGIQLGCVLSGGKLVQHMNHPSVHNLTLYDGTIMQTNSLHHQLQRVAGYLSPLEYVIAGWSKGLSNIYLNGDDMDVVLPSKNSDKGEYIQEPELVYYRKAKWFGIQGHPEMMPYNSRMNIILRSMIDLMMEGTLDTVLTLGIPTSRYVDCDLVLLDDEIQTYEQLLEKRLKFETV